MPLDWKYTPDGVDWEEMSALYLAAPFGIKSAEHLRKVFGNSLYKCFVFDDGRLVAAGRALADGGDCSYLCDIAVMPSHQGTGLGKQIVNYLVEQSRGYPQDHPLRRAGEGTVLQEVRLPAHDDGDGDLREPGAAARARLPERVLSPMRRPLEMPGSESRFAGAWPWSAR